jgi:DNA-binding transcriptional LysR family regulator
LGVLPVLMAQLEAFVEVARQGTMRQASDTLHLSQPALSARIAGLERALGARLFDRKKRGMTLTPAGKALLPHALRTIDAASAGVAIVRDFELGRAGEVIVGATPAISTYVLPDVICKFRQSCPTVRVFVRTNSSEEIQELVIRGDAHVGLVREHRVEYLSCEPLYSEELVLVAHSEHQLAHGNPVSAGDLLSTTLVMLDRRWASSGVLLDVFAASGTLPFDTIEIESVELAKQLVSRGVGVAMLPMTAVAREIDRGEFVRLPLTEARPVARRVVLVERPGAPAWAPLDAFRDLLRRIPDVVAGALSPTNVVPRPSGHASAWASLSDGAVDENANGRARIAETERVIFGE